MNDIKNLVASIESDIQDIHSELQIAEQKGVFNYPRGKNIRKAALEIAKKAKDLRETVSLTLKGEGAE